MSHSFDISTESSASVEQLHATFGREDYWQTRLSGDAATTLDSLIVHDDGSVTVRVTQHLGRQLLPGLVAKIVPGDLKLLYRETWRPTGDGTVRGEVSVSASGGLGSSRAQNWLVPVGSGSELRSTVKVDVKLPLVGGTLEKTIGASLTESIPEVLHFTTRWIDEHP
jgi:hypothetical protein